VAYPKTSVATLGDPPDVDWPKAAGQQDRIAICSKDKSAKEKNALKKIK
jgi:hypothetical protein